MSIILTLLCATPFVIWFAKALDAYLDKLAARHVEVNFPKRRL